MKMWLKLGPMIFMACLAWGGVVHGALEDAADSDCPDCCNKGKTEPVKLGDVFVTAFHGGAVTITPTKTVIDVEAFNKSGSVDRVEDILMHLTGIDVMRGSTGADPQQLIMMRGFDDSRFTIAIDGRTITAPTAGADTYVDWSSLTTGDIEKIEVIRGGASAMYENSQGGVINIITKKGKKREKLIPQLTVMSDASSYDTYTARSTVDGGIGDLTYFFNVGYKESAGYLRNNDYDGRDYSARVSYRFPFQGTLTASMKGSELNLGYAVVNDPNAVYGDYNPDYPVVPEDADTVRRYRNMSFAGGDNYKEKESLHKDLSFEQPIFKTLLKIQLYETTGAEDSYYRTLVANKAYNKETDPPEAKYVLAQSFSGDGDRREKHTGGRLNYKMELFDKHSVIMGYDERHMEVDLKPDIWLMKAGYVEDTFQIFPKLNALLGTRYTHVRENTYEYADPGTTEKYRHKITTDIWLPKSTITYQFTEDTSAFVSVNKDYHIPGC